MANTNTPFGLAYVRSQSANNSGVLRHYYIPSTNSDKLYVGDPVVKTGGSNATEILGHDAGSLASIAKAGTSGAITGVIMGFLPNGSDFISGSFPAGVEGVALVCDDLTAKFNILANGALTAAAIGSNANISVTTAGNDYAGISGVTLDVATIATTDSLQLKILNVAPYDFNEVGEYAVAEVLINATTEAHGTAGVAAQAGSDNSGAGSDNSGAGSNG